MRYECVRKYYVTSIAPLSGDRRRAGRSGPVCYDAPVLRPFPYYPACPVCGERAVNGGALELRWAWDEERRRAVGRFRPGADHGGYSGQVHGGLLSAMLDECLAWACAVEKRAYCVTGDLHVRFHSPARLGETLEIGAWTVGAWGPYVRAEGEVVGPARERVASATGTFAALSRAQSLELHAALRLRPGDLDVLAGEAPPPPLPESRGTL